VPNKLPIFLPRPEELEELKAKLLNVQQSVVVQGMGGLGKSVLAAAVAHDAEVHTSVS
jgi:DNA replication protein DnaC